ncbi:RDD family protein [Bacillus spongiae]|uniref:RDD family protein n=1 Tax=Bacillus spongiae TaxID=2683610 RepID=A0ABU8H8D0_9BACI
MSDNQLYESHPPEERIEEQIEILKKHETFVYAGFWMRLWAYVIDLIVIWSINGLVIYPIFRLFNLSLDNTSFFSAITITTTITFYAYFVLMTKFFQQTLGKIIFGLKVETIERNKLDWATVLFREVFGRYLSVTIWLLYIVIAFTKRKQGVHDLLADTTVVHERNAYLIQKQA